MDTLERPPQIASDPGEVQSRYSESEAQGEESELHPEEKKPSQNVRLISKGGSDTKLEILEPFDRAWVLVSKALNFDSAFQVTDRNRDKGILYVSYDPDGHGNSLWKNTLSFLTGGSEAEGDYIVRLVESAPGSLVTAEMVVEDDFDPEGDSIADPEAGVEQFLMALYKTLREI